MLFNRSGWKRTRDNLGQEFRMSIKRTVSDQMIELCNDFGSEFIEYETFTKIKHMIDEKLFIVYLVKMKMRMMKIKINYNE